MVTYIRKRWESFGFLEEEGVRLGVLGIKVVTL